MKFEHWCCVFAEKNRASETVNGKTEDSNKTSDKQKTDATSKKEKPVAESRCERYAIVILSIIILETSWTI